MILDISYSVLDKRIQIIIDGNRQNIEQGEDERGKFYKVYYKEEK